jgi:hypothetical protein
LLDLQQRQRLQLLDDGFQDTGLTLLLMIYSSFTSASLPNL